MHICTYMYIYASNFAYTHTCKLHIDIHIHTVYSTIDVHFLEPCFLDNAGHGSLCVEPLTRGTDLWGDLLHGSPSVPTGDGGQKELACLVRQWVPTCVRCQATPNASGIKLLPYRTLAPQYPNGRPAGAPVPNSRSLPARV